MKYIIIAFLLSGCSAKMAGAVLSGAGNGLSQKQQLHCHTKTYANGDSETHCEGI